MARNTNVFLQEQGLSDDQLAEWLSGFSQTGSHLVLYLGSNQLTHRSVEALASSELRLMVGLWLGNNPIGDDGARILAGGKAFGYLESLHVDHAEITANGVRNLLGDHSALLQLYALDFSGNAIGDEGAEIIAQSPLSQKLEKLYVNETGITERGLQALAASPNLARLQYFSALGIELTSSAIAEFSANNSFSEACECVFGDAE